MYDHLNNNDPQNRPVSTRMSAFVVSATGFLRTSLRRTPRTPVLPLRRVAPTSASASSFFARRGVPLQNQLHQLSRTYSGAATAGPTMTAAAAPEKAAPKTILLSDYTRPAYLVDSVGLTFKLDDAGEKTAVLARLEMRMSEEAKGDEDLVLDGELLELKSIAVDGKVLAEGDGYSVDDVSMTVKKGMLPAGTGSFVLESEVEIAPVKNKALEGLYMSSGNFCTQCEAEGFRRITYFPDRPDVMSKYTVRVEGNKALFPVLLSNGNMVETGAVPGDDTRHYAVYEDPWPKPAYLFALVAGVFENLEDSFKTRSGKNVTLRIYVKGESEVAKCVHAMESLKKAFKWEEDTYGLEYDLEIFNVVAVSDFSMGAMENKSLNIFNTRCVLASKDTATDGDFNAVEGVVAHEYFRKCFLLFSGFLRADLFVDVSATGLY